MEWKKIISEETEAIYHQVVEIRRHLHRYPELSFEEKETSAFIRNLLDKWGIPYEYPYVNHGFVASIEGEQGPGKTIALRTDMDALPIREETGLEFASANPGIMHACGHDMHMASMLGILKLLHSFRNRLRGTILFIFQPAEEKIPGGAKLMLEEGIFKNRKPDLVLAQHVLPDMEAGKVGFKSGQYMASSDELYLTIRGKGGHGALPEKVNDPVLITAQLLIALQQEINRKAPRGIPTVISFGRVTANGAVNVIPDHVELEGTFRTMDETWRALAHQMIIRISEGIAASMNGSAEVTIAKGYPVLFNDPEIARLGRSFAADMLGEDNVVDMDVRMTAEDFAWYSHSYPSLLYRFGTGEPGQPDASALHTSTFRTYEPSLKTGIAAMSYLAVQFLR